MATESLKIDYYLFKKRVTYGQCLSSLLQGIVNNLFLKTGFDNLTNLRTLTLGSDVVSALVNQAIITTATVAAQGKRKFPPLSLWLTQSEYCFGLCFTAQLHKVRVDLFFVIFLFLQYVCLCNFAYPC